MQQIGKDSFDNEFIFNEIIKKLGASDSNEEFQDFTSNKINYIFEKFIR